MTTALTPREEEITELLYRGYTNKEICRELNISLGTTKQHIAHIMKKLRAKSRGEVVYKWTRQAA